MSTIKVVAAVLDRQELELIKPDGSAVRLKQGDVRIRPILAQVKAAVESGNIPVEITLNNLDTTYTDFEEKTGGVVKLFRVGVSKLKKFFGFGKSGEEVEADLTNQVIGKVPDKLDNAIEEIMEQAIPASDAAFESSDSEAGRTEETVVVAVVDGKHVVPDADKLANQMRHSVKGSTEGIENFLRRCAAVAATRSHSVEDLMKFMHRGDLPVTVNGDIVAYKVLRRDHNAGFSTDEKHHRYVDCHTRKVKQKVGSRVFMAESLVDHNRRNECSNGLHVARRQYVGQFSGDVLTMIIVRPEDVIAVPEYDANKMRVCGYHIVFEMPDVDYREIAANRPLKTAEGKAALAAALSGNTIGITQTVEITAGHGNGLKITDLVDTKTQDEQAAEAVLEIDTSVQSEPINITEKGEIRDAPVDVKEMAQEAVQVKATGTRAEQAKALYEAWEKSGWSLDGEEYQALNQFKKAAKVGWAKLGLPVSPSGNVLPGWTQPVVEVAPVAPKPLVDPTPRGESSDTIKKKKLSAKQKKKAAAKAAYAKRSQPAQPLPAAPAANPSIELTTPKVEAPKASKDGPSARIRALIDGCTAGMTIGVAKEIVAIKKASKKSWEKLGVTQPEVDLILSQL